MISILGVTHPGQREHNEDCFIADSSRGLGLVADGMGGYACGEVASAMVQQVIEQAISNNEGLKEAIARAHVLVKEAAAADDKKQGMGSTAIAFKMQGLAYELAWVGDSRAYLWTQSQRTLKQISRDHSYVETLLSSGAINQQEALNHPNRNLITQAVGVAGEGGLDIEVVDGRLAIGQQLMICSDGLVDEVSDDDIAALMSAARNPAEALNNLLAAAVSAGGRDNITIVLASVDGHFSDEEQGLASMPQEPEAIRVTVLGSEVPSSAPLPTANDTEVISGLTPVLDTPVMTQGRAGIIAFLSVNAFSIVSGLLVVILLAGSLLYFS